MRKLVLTAAFLIQTSCLIFSSVFAQSVISFSTATSGLSDPVDIANAGDNRLFIVQQNGIIHIWNGSSLMADTFLNVSNLITFSGGEQGLLSMAFHPDYTVNHYFFIYYTNTSGDVTIARYTRDAVDINKADPNSGVILLSIPKPGTPYFQNHNGGKLNFGKDGMLYFGTGDGGSGGDPFNNAQNGTSLLGKMFRIDVSNFSNPPYYFIPADNPFISSGTVDHRLWAIGLRNPFRWSFDRLNGDMWIADVGQNAWEEVNYIPTGTSGLNFGWRCFEGAHTYDFSGCTTGYTPPILEYPHNNSSGGFCIIGGYVYRGSEFPDIYGTYMTLDYISGNFWQIRSNGSGGWNITMQSGLPSGFVSFGEAQDGTLYAVNKSSGTLNKVIVSPVLPILLGEFRVRHFAGYNEINWTTLTEQDTQKFLIEFSANGIKFLLAGEVNANNDPAGSSYSFNHYTNVSLPVYYRLGIKDNNGITKYSSIIKLSANETTLKINPSIIRTGILMIEHVADADKLQIGNSAGAVVFEKNLKGKNGNVAISLPFLPSGIYLVKVISNKIVVTKKIILIN